jgi:hypothetical protein
MLWLYSEGNLAPAPIVASVANAQANAPTEASEAAKAAEVAAAEAANAASSAPAVLVTIELVGVSSDSDLF